MPESACAARSCARWRSWLGSPRARTSPPRCSPPGRRREAGPPRWRSGRRAVPGAEAPVAHQKSFPTTCAQCHRIRSLRARPENAVREPAPGCETWRTHLTGNAVQLVQGLGGSEIPTALFLLIASPQSLSQRSVLGTHRGDRHDEAAQSQVRLCANRPADLSVFSMEMDEDVVRRGRPAERSAPT